MSRSERKSSPWMLRKFLWSVLVLMILLVSVFAGVYLADQDQNISERAAVSNMCPGAQQCPHSTEPNHLWSCSPGESDGTVNDQICNRIGKTGTCGGRQYCCPAVNGAWTTDMTACATAATPTPSPAPTSAPTLPPTAAPTSVPTNPATPRPSSTPLCTPRPDGQPKIGDLNRDNCVNIVDVGILIDNYGL